jgi:hypothetical protein
MHQFKLHAISTVCTYHDLNGYMLTLMFADIHVLLEAEKEIQRGRNRFLELFTIPRNRRATTASFIVMFM